MKQLLTFMFFFGFAVSTATAQNTTSEATAAAAQRSTIPYVDPDPGEYHTGVLTENGALRLANGKLLQLVNENSQDLTGQDPMVGNIFAFRGRTITVRGLRYNSVAAGAPKQQVLAVQSFGPGDDHNFVAGRLGTDEHGVFLRSKGEKQIYFKGELAKRMRPHAQTLNTTIGMGDGVILYGDVQQGADGTLTLSPTRPDVWYLMRPRELASVGDESRIKDGVTYRLLGLQTPATSRNDPATDLPAYGHLEVPLDMDLGGVVIGTDRAFVRGTPVKSAKELAFKQRHKSIRIKGTEFSGPIAGSISGSAVGYGDHALKRMRPAKSNAKRTTR